MVLKHRLESKVRVLTDGKDTDWTGTSGGNDKFLGTKDFCQKVLGYGLEYRVDGHSELVNA